MAMTTLIPTFLYLCLLVVMILAKVIVTASRVLAMHLLELFTERDPATKPKEFMPGTLLGILLAVVAALGKFLAAL